MNKLLCKLLGHKWDSVHGFHNEPNFSAICLRCGLQDESYEEWEKRYFFKED